MVKRLPVLLMLAFVLSFSVPVLAVSAHTKIPNNLVSCAEDTCDGILPAQAPNDPTHDYASCPSPTRDNTVNMIDSQGHLAGYLYFYSHTGSTCDETVWGTVHLNTGYNFPVNLSMAVYTTRTSSGETLDEDKFYFESGNTGVYSDAPMAGYEDYPNAYDCFNNAVDWEDQYGQGRHDQSPQLCYLGH